MIIGELGVGKWGFIDKTGKMVIAPQFDVAGTFYEGLSPVALNRENAYIDKTGKVVFIVQCDVSGFFAEGLATVEIAGKKGYLDKSGEIVINPQYDEVRPFSHGWAAVRIENKWGYIDKTGRYSGSRQVRCAVISRAQPTVLRISVGRGWNGMADGS